MKRIQAILFPKFSFSPPAKKVMNPADHSWEAMTWLNEKKAWKAKLLFARKGTCCLDTLLSLEMWRWLWCSSSSHSKVLFPRPRTTAFTVSVWILVK
jgi:hypothetical protein